MLEHLHNKCQHFKTCLKTISAAHWNLNNVRWRCACNSLRPIQRTQSNNDYNTKAVKTQKHLK